MKSFATYLEESTISTEEVKTAIVYYINDALLASAANHATISIGKTNIKNVVAAKPSTRSSTGGVLPYVDIELILTNGSKINIGVRVAKSKKFLVYRGKQLRGAAVPALYNGIHSLDKMYPEVREHYISSILEYYRNKGYDHGSSVPTVYGKIDGEIKKKILLGDSKHGGVIDYIFAIDRAPMRYKRMKIPKMKESYNRNEFIIRIGDTRAFTASEVLANNNVYIWSARRHDRLYLGNDRVDQTNLPAIFGPPDGAVKEYGTKKYRVGLNISSKDSVDIKDNKRIFQLELKSPKDLMTNDAPEETSVSNQSNIDRSRSQSRNIDTQKDQEEYGESLSPDARQTIVDQIVGNAERGMRHRYKIDLDREQLDNIRDTIEDMDDNNLKRMASTPSHRLASEIKKDYM